MFFGWLPVSVAAGGFAFHRCWCSRCYTAGRLDLYYAAVCCCRAFFRGVLNFKFACVTSGVANAGIGR